MATGSESVIVRDPDILSGQHVVRGTRVPFQALPRPKPGFGCPLEGALTYPTRA